MERFPDHARVCFLGDSITAHCHYVRHIIAAYLERFPQADMRFFNGGVVGAGAGHLLSYFDDTVTPRHPTHVVVMTGINDSARWLLNEPRSIERYDSLRRSYDRYRANLTALCERIEAIGATVVLCTPPPYAEYEVSAEEPLRGGAALMEGYADFVRHLAEKRGYALVDQHAYLMRACQEERLFWDDHIHLNERGHYYAARNFLTQQGLAGAEDAPIPPWLFTWAEKNARVQETYAVECMIIHDFSLPQEQKTQIVRDYIARGEFASDWFHAIAEGYLVNQPQREKLRAETDDMMATGWSR